MTEWQNDRMTGWQDDCMTEWQNDRMIGWLDDWMTGWPNDRMTGWPIKQMSGWREALQTIDRMVYFMYNPYMQIKWVSESYSELERISTVHIQLQHPGVLEAALFTNQFVKQLSRIRKLYRENWMKIVLLGNFSLYYSSHRESLSISDETISCFKIRNEDCAQMLS